MVSNISFVTVRYPFIPKLQYRYATIYQEVQFKRANNGGVVDLMPTFTI